MATRSRNTKQNSPKTLPEGLVPQHISREEWNLLTRSERNEWLNWFEAYETSARRFRGDYIYEIERAVYGDLVVTAQERQPEYKLKVAGYLYEQGVQFMTPVRLNTKMLAHRGSENKPIKWETLQRLVYEFEQVRHQKRYAHDLAVRTGNWHMPSRNYRQTIIVFDVDDYDQLPQRVQDILPKYETFVVQTSRGLHFYFWVNGRFGKSGSNPTVADWQGKGRIAVLTGADRRVLHWKPVAALPDEVAKILYKFATQPPEPPPKRWSIAVAAGIEPFLGPKAGRAGDFHAVEGERNTRINGELYRMRFRMSDDELRTYALELAAKCSPPYPEKEALQVAASIIRHRRRLPLAPKAATFLGNNVTREVKDAVDYQLSQLTPYREDFRRTRLAKYFPNAGDTFTRKEYESRLIADGWKPDKRGRVEVARLDIEYNLKSGVIEAVGKLPAGKKGGNRQILYCRRGDYEGRLDHLLPGKVTHRQIRLSAMAAILPTTFMEVVRGTICPYLGIKSESTITRYAALLSDAQRWGQPLIEKKVQPPLITTWALDPENELTKRVYGWPIPRQKYYYLRSLFFSYRPSLYRVTPYYRWLLDNTARTAGNTPSARKSQPTSPANQRTLRDLLAELSSSRPASARLRGSTPSGQSPRSASALPLEPCYNGAKKTTTSSTRGIVAHQAAASGEKGLFHEHERLCPACERHLIEEPEARVCAKCQKRRKKIEQDRYERNSPTPNVGREDYCLFCDQFFLSEAWPLTRVCPACEEIHFNKKAPTCPLYCPNPRCRHKIYVTHYENWQTPAQCPACKQAIAPSQWRLRPPVREEKLPGYPINHYLNTFQTVFEVMDEYFDRPDISLREFEAMFSPEELAAWHAYHDAKFKTVHCKTCGDPVKVLRTAPDEVEKCGSCLIDEEMSQPLPDYVQEIVDGNKLPSLEHVKQTYRKLFKELPERTERDIEKAYPQYGGEWIELALHFTYRFKWRIRHLWPHTAGILKNWQKQGGVNLDWRDYLFIQRRGDRLRQRGWYGTVREVEAVYLWENVFIAFDTHIAPLKPLVAHELQRALQKYGERPLRYAFAEAVRCRVRRWSYCRAILERLEREGGLDELGQESDRI